MGTNLLFSSYVNFTLMARESPALAQWTEVPSKKTVLTVEPLSLKSKGSISVSYSLDLSLISCSR